MLRILSRFLFWVTGWKTVGQIPPHKKMVVIGAPHTSGWDVVYGLAASYILRIKFRFFGKQELFVFPLGIFWRALGGIPVDRFAHHNMVDIAVQKFNEHDEFILAMSPEATRAYAPVWRKGFYYIALKAQVPIVLTYLDFEHKTVGIGPTFYPTGNYEKDIEEIKNFYRPIKGKYPELGVH